MKRTQIQLTEEQAEFLEKISREEGISKAQVIRDALDEKRRSPSGTDRDWDRLLELAGKYESGRTHVSEDHDEELSDIFLK